MPRRYLTPAESRDLRITGQGDPRPAHGRTGSSRAAAGGCAPSPPLSKRWWT